MKRLIILVLLLCASMAAQVTLTTTSMMPAYSGQFYHQQMTASGSGGGFTYSLASGSLPPSMSLSSLGVVSGTSSTLGYYTFSITVTDALLNTMTRSYWMNVWPVLDMYGGLNTVTVPGCSIGYFQIKQIGTHWIWADPSCNAFQERSVYNVQGYIDPKTYCNVAPINCVSNKFGGNYINWYNNIFHILSQIGFNSVDIYSRDPSANYPHALFWNTLGDLYNGNRGCPNQILPNDTGCGFGTVPVGATPAPLFVCDGQNAHGYNHCGSGYLTYDVFNPNYSLASYNGTSDATHIDELYLIKLNHPSFNTSPWIFYVSLGDASLLDALTGPGVSAITGGATYPDPAALVAMSNFHFVETGNYACAEGSTYSSCGWPSGGAPQDLWSKYAWTCGKAGVDFGWGVGKSYLQFTYANIAALNTAWGSSYTTFCDSGGWSTGTGVLDEDGTGAWFASDGSNNNPAVYSQAGMNAHLKTDLANFLQKFAYQAYYTQLHAVKIYDTNHMIGVGSYGGAGNGGVRTAVTKGITQAGIDLWIWNWNNIYPTQAATVDVGEYNDTCAAGKCTPGAVWYGISAVGDSSWYLCWNGTSVNGWGSCPGTGADASCTVAGGLCTGHDPGHGGQESRGALYARDMSPMWNSTAADGKQWNLGTVWWEYSDNSSEGNDWGLVSYQSNPYNGNSATSLGGVDPWGQVEGEFSDTAQSGTYVYTQPPAGYGNMHGTLAQTNLAIMNLLLGPSSQTTSFTGNSKITGNGSIK